MNINHSFITLSLVHWLSLNSQSQIQCSILNSHVLRWCTHVGLQLLSFDILVNIVCNYLCFSKVDLTIHYYIKVSRHCSNENTIKLSNILFDFYLWYCLLHIKFNLTDISCIKTRVIQRIAIFNLKENCLKGFIWASKDYYDSLNTTFALKTKRFYVLL